MKVAITGATGFIGRQLALKLLEDRHEVFALTRNPQKAAESLPASVTPLSWQHADSSGWKDAVSVCDAFVNLAGENLSAGRWTTARKAALLESRLQAIASLREVLTSQKGMKRTLIEASAVGYYGPRGDEKLSEKDPPGTGYLSEIATRCEREADQLSNPDLRVVAIRTGIVLGREGGILSRLFAPLRLGAGGYPGNGTQWLSWIHMDDEIRAILYLLSHPELTGSFNLTAPEPMRMRDFVKLGGAILHRPVWVPLPAPLLRLMFGEMADEALLTGQRVLPERLLESGFQFEFPTAESALRAVL